MRRTKIVCTLGPATSSGEGIRSLLEAGADVIRLNFSHSDRETHRETIRRLRLVAADLGREVTILQDLGGPKIRLGVLPPEGITVAPGDELRLSGESPPPPGALGVTYPRLSGDVRPGDPILLADGSVELRVVRVEGRTVVCTVLAGGRLTSHKGVNLPHSALSIPAFTPKDRLDLQVGLEEGVDVVALSFVRDVEDLRPVREVLSRADTAPLLVAKIEKPQAVENLEAITEAVDGLMVARGDLGVELAPERVPLIQKRIIRAAIAAAKPVITATQMLGSMVASPRPTRAEASDVANAVLDGTDAVMLSEETAVGKYPAEAVATLDRIARTVEPSLDHARFLEAESGRSAWTTPDAIANVACRLALDLGARAIVAATTSGATARLVARYRPSVPVIALTPRTEVLRQLGLTWGVIPAPVEAFPGTDAAWDLARRWVVEHGLAGPGDRVIVVAGTPLNTPGTTNLVRVVEVHGRDGQLPG